MNITPLKRDDVKTTQDFMPLIRRYDQARTRRQHWESHWQECYDYALPQRGDFQRAHQPGGKRSDRLFDGTALDAVDQLAASLLGNLTPPWTQWFGFKPGPDLSAEEAEALAPLLEETAKTIQAHFDRSNFAVEMHQAFLDLVVGGTASLAFEETAPGSFSAFKFSAVPLNHIVLEEGENGFLDGSFKSLSLTLAQLEARYPLSEIPVDVIQKGIDDPQARFDVLESVLPQDGLYDFKALLIDDGDPVLLTEGRFAQSPVIAFRWMKTPGEIYGRSPVMKALPDIKTANKVVELILKNASIASAGIRHALLTDRLGQISDRRMTATEVLERAAETALLLGATYGRLQSELLTPLVQRAFAILKRRGEIPDIALDGRYVALDYRSPLARAQGQRSVSSTLTWIDSVIAMGPAAAEAVDLARTARFIGEALGVPSDLIRKEIPLPPLTQESSDVSQNKTAP